MIFFTPLAHARRTDPDTSRMAASSICRKPHEVDDEEIATHSARVQPELSQSSSPAPPRRYGGMGLMADNTAEDSGAGTAKATDGTERLTYQLPEGATRAQLIAELTMNTIERNALTAKGYTAHHCNAVPQQGEAMKVVAAMCGKVRSGNLDDLTDMLTAQALTLDSMFTEYGRRAMTNLGQYPDAVERYTSLAAKAQAQCRTTVDTLARVKRGGKQTVKVVHVYQGGQAVVADTFSHGGSGGRERGHFQDDGQPHDQGAPIAALPGQDESGVTVPVPRNARQEAVPFTWREGNGCAEGQPQRMETRG